MTDQPPKFYTADICSDHENQVQVCLPVFRDYGGRMMFHGRIETVRTFESNAIYRELLGTDGSGKVLVVDGGGSLNRALVGGNVALAAADNGWAGLVIFGCVRDSHELIETAIGIKALALNPMRPRGGPVYGEVGVPVNFAGVRFEPGAYLYADGDGIVVAAEHFGG